MGCDRPRDAAENDSCLVQEWNRTFLQPLETRLQSAIGPQEASNILQAGDTMEQALLASYQRQQSTENYSHTTWWPALRRKLNLVIDQNCYGRITGENTFECTGQPGATGFTGIAQSITQYATSSNLAIFLAVAGVVVVFFARMLGWLLIAAGISLYFYSWINPASVTAPASGPPQGPND